ncbi:MAG: RNA-guided endonuclease IscB [Cyanobacteriota bacterium]|nr:RNA-guided endonuclease IscB [Cyanobacteriota bacterium]
MNRLNHKTNYVFVVDRNKKPLQLCSPARARILQDQGKAKKLKMYPFTLILDQEIEAEVTQELEIRIDPGSKTSGIALIDIKTQRCFWALHIEHRGESIKQSLISRAGYRRSRRTRNVRHRKARFHQRRKPQGWLPPSLMHRVQTIETWVKRISKVCNVTKISIERAKFDTQLMENESIKGKEYQQGTLMGYEIREFLLERLGRKCSYCGAYNVSLEVEHIHPKSKGGSNRISNLCLSCHECNEEKADRDVEDFLQDKPDVLKKIKAQQKKSLKDVAAVNCANNKLFQVIKNSFEDVEIFEGRGSLTKMTRIKNEQPKYHWIDAANVAGLPVKLTTLQPLIATCKGHGNRQMVKNNDSGFPDISNMEEAPNRNKRKITQDGKVTLKGRKKVKKDKNGNRIPSIYKAKQIYRHATAGDIVEIEITENRYSKSKKGKPAILQVLKGKYKSRVKTPTKKGVEVVVNQVRTTVQNSNVKYIHRNDGYAYQFLPINSDLLQLNAIC